MFKYFAISALTVYLWGLQATSQRTEAVCRSTYSWMQNTLGQNPCLVAAYLQGSCVAGGDWHVPAIPNSTQTYAGPDLDQTNLCTCSSVVFDLLSACAYCQGDAMPFWGDWITNCPTNEVSNGQFPGTIPTGTAVPSWAYQVVVDQFNVSTAQSLAQSHPPDSTAPGPSSLPITSSTSSSIFTTSSFSSTSSSSSSSSSSVSSSTTPLPGPTTPAASKSSNTAAIAGGAAGGAVVLILVVIGAYWLYRRNRTPSVLPTTTTEPDMSQPHQPFMPMPPTPQTPSPFVPVGPPAGIPPPDSPPMRLYNPDDPSTFPQAPDMPMPFTTISPGPSLPSPGPSLPSPGGSPGQIPGQTWHNGSEAFLNPPGGRM